MKWSRCFGIILVVACLWGCARSSKPDLLERNWGRSVETQKYTQILNPHAGDNLTPVVGIEGEASTIIHQKNIESYKEAAPQPIYNINIGGLGGSGSK